MSIHAYMVVIPLIVVTPAAALLAVLASLFDRSGNASHRVARLWARSLLWFSQVRVEVTGAEHVDPDGTYVFAANHSSMFDILVLLAALPVQFRWMAKEELFRIPFLGWGMKSCGYIPVNRSNPREGVRSLIRAAERIQAGSSVIIFPEGTRSRTGEVGAFKHGGFTLAVKSGQPIVPVSISGARRVLPAKTLALKPGPIKVAIGPPISTADADRKDQTALMDRVRREIVSRFEPDYGRKPVEDGHV